MSLNKIFDEFNGTYGIDRKPLDSNLQGLLDIVGSEYIELRDEVSVNPLDDEPLYLKNPHNFVKEGLDIVYATLQQLRERGVDIDAGLAELHRSNMSKTVSANNCVKELEIALKRYPFAVDTTEDFETFVLKCSKSGKVIKPTCYSSAVITDEIIGK